MAANTIYISAGLPVAKNSGQAPSSGVNTVYVSAGLPPVVLNIRTLEVRSTLSAFGQVGIFSGPLEVTEDTFSVDAPFDADKVVDTVQATGGVAPYTWEIISQVQS